MKYYALKVEIPNDPFVHCKWWAQDNDGGPCYWSQYFSSSKLIASIELTGYLDMLAQIGHKATPVEVGFQAIESDGHLTSCAGHDEMKDEYDFSNAARGKFYRVHVNVRTPHDVLAKEAMDWDNGLMTPAKFESVPTTLNKDGPWQDLEVDDLAVHKEYLEDMIQELVNNAIESGMVDEIAMDDAIQNETDFSPRSRRIIINRIKDQLKDNPEAHRYED